MARILVVFHRPLWSQWRSTYDSHVNSFKLVEGHECLYLNTAWPAVPKYIKSLDPDVVIFHYTFLAVRQHPSVFEEQLRSIGFLKDVSCPKALVPHDEQAHADLLCSLAREFGVTHVFTPAAPSEWPKIYRGLDFDATTFKTVLTGYVDDSTVARLAARSMESRRPIDVGYRSWSIRPFYGRHGLLKGEVGRVFQERAPKFGLMADISSDHRDAFLGDDWFDFLLKCKYTIGVEGGSSVLDYDGSIAERTRVYMAAHPDASFEMIEAACFPEMDGRFDYFLLGPRHLEAVMTRTCQVLIEGEYGGTMEPGKHYISLKKDFSNLDEVLEVMKLDEAREGIVERAYRDVIESGRWTYSAFARLVLDTCLEGVAPARTSTLPMRVRLARNRAACTHLGETLLPMLHPASFPRAIRIRTRDAAAALLGEERLWRFLVGGRNLTRRVLGKPPLELGPYVPTASEIARRERRSYRRTPKQFARDAVVLAVGEERLWRVLVSVRNAVRRVRGLPALSQEYVPTPAEVERRAARQRRRSG